MAGKTKPRPASPPPADRPRQPWDLWPGEGPKSYAGFIAYRNLGPDRSLPKVARILHVSGRLVGGWSAKFAWGFRAEQWDATEQRRVDERILQIHTEQVENWRILSSSGLAATAQALTLVLNKLNAKDAEAPPFWNVISGLREMIELQKFVAAESMARLERTAHLGDVGTARRMVEERLDEIGGRFDAVLKGEEAREEQERKRREAVKPLQEPPPPAPAG